MKENSDFEAWLLSETLLAGLLGAILALFLTHPSMRTRFNLPELRLVLETTMTLAGLLVAVLAAARFSAEGRRVDLLLASGFLVTSLSAAGFGVLNNATYTGPYNSAAYQQHFQIGPGVAPKADLYAVRVFGRNGSTDVVTDAINWAVANNVDVISMSLGSNYGDANTADAIAVHNAVLAGITVVSASGNAGPAPYITSSPASGTGGITAAAMDGTPGFPGVNIALNTGPSATLSSAGIIPNPAFETIASFSSGGPRYGDSFFQPSVTAPGVSVFSTASGTGVDGQALSGTSMATPHIAGVAALVRQAHPGWSELAQRAAITQTGDRFQMVGYSARLAGTGVVQPLPATQTQAVVLGTASDPERRCGH